MVYKRLVRPLLFRVDPERVHDATLFLLARGAALEPLLRRLFAVRDERLKTRIAGLEFPNPVGLAPGFDKNGTALSTWSGLGFGFVEIGAITAGPQPGNPKPRLYRLPEDRALINRLGFNNAGAPAIAGFLHALRERAGGPAIPLGINIGRSKAVPSEGAARDYVFTFATLYPYGDYFTLNVSSPNTPHLRDLQQRVLLDELLQAIQEKNQALARQRLSPPKPVFLKIAPDMDFRQLDDIIEAALSHRLAGIVATNASAFLREKLKTPCAEAGGLSGEPLRELATSFIRHIYQSTRGRLAVIGSGGIFTAQDAYAKITAGASAVQILTGFVYEGPGAVKRINRGLLELLRRDGFGQISEAVGSGVRPLG
jgi:dihydroorotate dehydrogenase